MSPAQRRHRPSDLVWSGDDVAGEPSKLQGASAPKSSFGSVKNHSTKALGLANSLTKSYPLHNTLIVC